MSDYAGALTPEGRARIERVLEEGERTTGAQIVVAVFRSLEGESLEDFSIRLAERWRVGRKQLDDGAIVLVFLEDRKARVEVGYGLEGAIPDIEASRIIRETIAPRFREGRYDAGLEAAARTLYARVETKAPAERRGTRARGGNFPVVGVVGFFVILAIIAVMLYREAATTRRLARGYTAGRRGWAAPPIIFFPWFGGGSRGGGGGGDGGFGGFSSGGGGFGGGGASGDW